MEKTAASVLREKASDLRRELAELLQAANLKDELAKQLDRTADEMERDERGSGKPWEQLQLGAIQPAPRRHPVADACNSIVGGLVVGGLESPAPPTASPEPAPPEPPQADDPEPDHGNRGASKLVMTLIWHNPTAAIWSADAVFAHLPIDRPLIVTALRQLHDRYELLDKLGDGLYQINDLGVEHGADQFRGGALWDKHHRQLPEGSITGANPSWFKGKGRRTGVSTDRLHKGRTKPQPQEPRDNSGDNSGATDLCMQVVASKADYEYWTQASVKAALKHKHGKAVPRKTVTNSLARLAQAGLLERLARGRYRITKLGREKAHESA